MTFGKLVCFAVLVCLAVSPSLLAQSAGTGALTGTVTDPTGGVVPGAMVTLDQLRYQPDANRHHRRRRRLQVLVVATRDLPRPVRRRGLQNRRGFFRYGERNRDSRFGPTPGCRRANRSGDRGGPDGNAADRDLYPGQYGRHANRHRASAQQPQLYPDPGLIGGDQHQRQQCHGARQGHPEHERQRQRPGPEQLSDGRREHHQLRQ